MSREPKWTDLPPDERARRLRTPISITHVGADKSWGGANISENRKPAADMVMPRDQWYLTDRSTGEQ